MYGTRDIYNWAAVRRGAFDCPRASSMMDQATTKNSSQVFEFLSGLKTSRNLHSVGPSICMLSILRLSVLPDGRVRIQYQYCSAVKIFATIETHTVTPALRCDFGNFAVRKTLVQQSTLGLWEY
jgi:hypothetical protein